MTNIFIFDEITHEKAEIVCKEIFENYNDEIDLYLNSGGGSLDAARAIISAMKWHKNVTTHLLGYSYSSAAVIWVAGQTRFAYPYSGVGFHPVTLNLGESWHDSTSMYSFGRWLKDEDKLIKELFSSAVTTPTTKEETPYWWERKLRGAGHGVTLVKAEELIEMGVCKLAINEHHEREKRRINPYALS